MLLKAEIIGMADYQPDEKYIRYRQLMLPEQLERARRKYIMLVREAHKLDMNWLLTNYEMFEIAKRND